MRPHRAIVGRKRHEVVLPPRVGRGSAGPAAARAAQKRRLGQHGRLVGRAQRRRAAGALHVFGRGARAPEERRRRLQHARVPARADVEAAALHDVERRRHHLQLLRGRRRRVEPFEAPDAAPPLFLCAVKTPWRGHANRVAEPAVIVQEALVVEVDRLVHDRRLVRRVHHAVLLAGVSPKPGLDGRSRHAATAWDLAVVEGRILHPQCFHETADDGPRD